MKKKFCYILAAMGFAMLAAGVWLLKTGQNDSGIAPYLCVGFGCGIFGQNVGELLSRHAVRKNPEIAKQLEIEKKDERNTALRNRAQAKAFNIMLPVFGALFVAFGLMGVEMRVVLLLMAAYLFVCGCSIYYRIKYEREM